MRKQGYSYSMSVFAMIMEQAGIRRLSWVVDAKLLWDGRWGAFGGTRSLRASSKCEPASMPAAAQIQRLGKGILGPVPETRLRYASGPV